MTYGIFKPGNPNDPSYLLFPHDDKLIHMGLFGGATLLFILSLVLDWKMHERQAIWYVVVSGLFFASLTEPIQYFVPFRSPDWFDFLSNVMGVFVAIGIYLRIKKSGRLPEYR